MILEDRGYQLQKAFGAGDVSSPAMKKAIGQWFALYYGGCGPGEDGCQQIPYTIVRKLVAAVFAEYQARCGEKDETALAALDAVAREAVQQALIGGECYLLPEFGPEGVRFQVVGRGDVLVFRRDSQGEPTDVGLVRSWLEGRFRCTLLERRTLEGDSAMVRLRLFRSAGEELGGEVPLSVSPLTRGLPREDTLPLPGLGLVRLRTPMANCIDGSREGVSVYAPAVGLIGAIGENEAQLRGEFRRGQSRLVVSRDLLRDGQLESDLFVALDDDPGAVGITAFSPELREQSYLARQQAYLRSVENVIGLKRGLLSQVEAVERTATEITSSQGEYAMTVGDFQRMWEAALVDAMALIGGGEVKVSWGNGLLYDADKVNEQMFQQVTAGVLAPERYLAWYYGLPDKSREDLAKVREAYMASGALTSYVSS